MRNLSHNHHITLLAYHLEQGTVTRAYHVCDGFDVVSVPVKTIEWERCWSQFSRTKRIAHDVLCIRDYELSESFRSNARKIVGSADVVIVAHPYHVFTARTHAKRDAIIVYESYNVEFDAKLDHFASVEPGLRADYLQQVYYAESVACRSANYVTAVSSADADRLANLYSIDRRRIKVVPNGVDTSSYPVLSADDRSAFRDGLGIRPDEDVAVFVGSAYGPNVNAYRRARSLLSAAGFGGSVIVIGSIATADRTDWELVAFNEIWTGFVEDEVRIAAVSSADFALHFMFDGAGTNLKLFDYMAARTLIVANDFAVRGVSGDDWYIRAPGVEEMKTVIAEKPWNTAGGKAAIEQARRLAERQFDWKAIADQYNSIISGLKYPDNASESESLDPLPSPP